MKAGSLQDWTNPQTVALFIDPPPVYPRLRGEDVRETARS
jgi:hypothetical protein